MPATAKLPSIASVWPVIRRARYMVHILDQPGHGLQPLPAFSPINVLLRNVQAVSLRSNVWTGRSTWPRSISSVGIGAGTTPGRRGARPAAIKLVGDAQGSRTSQLATHSHRPGLSSFAWTLPRCPGLPPSIARVRSACGPVWTGMQTRSGSSRRDNFVRDQEGPDSGQSHTTNGTSAGSSPQAHMGALL
jgi:hypothetical protein